MGIVLRRKLTEESILVSSASTTGGLVRERVYHDGTALRELAIVTKRLTFYLEGHFAPAFLALYACVSAPQKGLTRIASE